MSLLCLRLYWAFSLFPMGIAAFTLKRKGENTLDPSIFEKKCYTYFAVTSFT